MNKKFYILMTMIIILLLILVGEIGYIAFQRFTDQPQPPIVVQPANNPLLANNEELVIEKFSSVEDFKNYLALAEGSNYGMFSGSMISGAVRTTTDAIEESAPVMTSNDIALDTKLTESASFSLGSGDDSLERYSETNVQVMGIDEPDLVKTDGSNIYYSPEYYDYWLWEDPFILEDSVEAISPTPETSKPKTSIINALPIEELKISGGVSERGDLLLHGNDLIIFSHDEIVAYDITSVTEPIEKWRYRYDEDTSLMTARLKGDDLYLITDSYINYNNPCPIKPLIGTTETVEIACNNIYYPSIPSYTDTTYSAIKLDASTGSVSSSTSVVGAYSNISVYMSSDNLYLGYYYRGDEVRFMAGFISANPDIFPTWVIDKVKKLLTYDISDYSKEAELSSIIMNWMQTLSNDDELKVENELENRMDTYAKEHIRELSSTTIMKVSLKDLLVKQTGMIPGKLLNQFSMDEYKGYLRVATTIGANFSGRYTINDVYVLDEDLEQVSAILNLGEGETIYSVRFMEDEGYVVTFEQIDPFYVLDLSNPHNAQKVGELKIPGYSSYLHPLKENTILGLGKEDSQVKISVFDVTDSANPIEKDKYLLKEYWSDVLNTHHAYLQDSEHEVFFLPGGSGGYIFSYANDKLELKKAVSEIYPDRAVYINDYLYIVSPDKIVVLDENTWETVKELELK